MKAKWNKTGEESLNSLSDYIDESVNFVSLSDYIKQHISTKSN